MAADSVRPFIVGLLFVYLLDPPVRWLVRLRIPRTLAILIVYVVVDLPDRPVLRDHPDAAPRELIQFIEDLPTLVEDLDAQLQQLGEFYAQRPDPGRDPRLDRRPPGSIGQEGGVGAGTIDLDAAAPGPDRGHQPDRPALRLPDPPGLGGLPAQGPGRADGGVRSGDPGDAGGSTCGPSSGPSSACSANGSAARSSSAFGRRR